MLLLQLQLPPQGVSSWAGFSSCDTKMMHDVGPALLKNLKEEEGLRARRLLLCDLKGITGC